MISTFSKTLVWQEVQFQVAGVSCVLMGALQACSTNCVFTLLFIRHVQKAVEVSGRYSVPHTTTSHSWAAFMNGNHLQKVRRYSALFLEIILVYSLLCCFQVNFRRIDVSLARIM